VHRQPAPKRSVSKPRHCGAAALDAVAKRLSAGGFIAYGEEARELLAAAGENASLLEHMLARRLRGEPLAWICGRTRFCGIELTIDSSVYVPRWHTELVAHCAAALLHHSGTAIDLCTGSGAVARVLQEMHPRARIIATDVDSCAVACARRNGVDALFGSLFAPLPLTVRGRVDVVVAVVPYVPTCELPLLQRDTFTFEDTLAYDGGPDGVDILRRVIAESTTWLRAGGALVLELGRRQLDVIANDLQTAGFNNVQPIIDEDGDLRGISSTRALNCMPISMRRGSISRSFLAQRHYGIDLHCASRWKIAGGDGNCGKQ
jgi:release factor glutamine methyltransferase